LALPAAGLSSTGRYGLIRKAVVGQFRNDRVILALCRVLEKYKCQKSEAKFFYQDANRFQTSHCVHLKPLKGIFLGQSKEEKCSPMVGVQFQVHAMARLKALGILRKNLISDYHF